MKFSWSELETEDLLNISIELATAIKVENKESFYRKVAEEFNEKNPRLSRSSESIRKILTKELSLFSKEKDQRNSTSIFVKRGD